MKREGPEIASTRKKGKGSKKQISDEARATEKNLAVSPVRHGAMNRRHFSLREIAQHLNISKTLVFEILKESEECLKFSKLFFVKINSCLTNFPVFTRFFLLEDRLNCFNSFHSLTNLF